MARITRMTKRRLGELLQAEGLITEDQVRAGLEEQRKSNMFLGEALVKLGFLSEEVIAQTIVQQFSLPFISSQQYAMNAEVLAIFPERMYYEYQYVAVDKIGKVLVIIGAGLMNHDVLDELERLSGCKVCQFVSTWKDIRATLEKHAKDLRKDQGTLNNLGSMLLDHTPAPMPIPKLPPAPAVAGHSDLGTMLLEKHEGPSIPASIDGGAKTNTSTAIPKPAALPAAASGKTGLVLTPPKLVTGLAQDAARMAGASAGTAMFPGTQGMPAHAPAASAPAAKLTATPPQGLPGPARLSALTSIRPPTGAPQVKAPSSTPNLPAVKEAPPEAVKAPPAPTTKTGLLGLFKKS